MPAFSSFDTRNYPTVTPREGYRVWSASYEETIKEDMDLRLLERIRTIRWDDVERAADLGCGTGRTGSWLRARSVWQVDGVDFTPEMLGRSRARGVYDRLELAEVTDSGLDAGRYALVTTVLVDEHHAALGPLYCEAARLAQPGAAHVLVGFHPFFIMKSGMPTHFVPRTERRWRSRRTSTSSRSMSRPPSPAAGRSRRCTSSSSMSGGLP